MQIAIFVPWLVLGAAAFLGIRGLWALLRKRFRPKLLIAAAVLGLIVYPSLVVTPPGHRGVIYSQVGGVRSAERVEGLSFVVPFLQSATQVDVRTQKRQVEAFAQSSDLQEITVPIAVNFHVQPDQAAEIYRTVGLDYGRVLIDPAVLQLAKAEIGLILAEDFARNRDALAEAIRSQLATQLQPYGLVVEFVAVEDAVFDPDFIKAVKDKVIAEQVAEKEERLVAAAENQARQVEATAVGAAARIRIEAEAQAEANRQIALSLTPNLLVWRRISTWNGVLPQTMVGIGDPLGLIFETR